MAAYIVEDVKGHFAEFDRCKRKYNVKDCDCDVSNFDETGFQIGVVTSDRVYVSLNCEAIYTVDPDDREFVTAVATINYGATKVTCVVISKTRTTGILWALSNWLHKPALRPLLPKAFRPFLPSFTPWPISNSDFWRARFSY